jgi:hypothetical protein
MRGLDRSHLFAGDIAVATRSDVAADHNRACAVGVAFAQALQELDRTNDAKCGKSIPL